MMTQTGSQRELNTNDMANTFNKQNKIVFDTIQIKKLERQLRKMSTVLEQKQAQAELDKVLRKAVTPWQKAVNGGWMYKYATKDQGRLQDPFGNTKIKAKRRHLYGRRVGPKLKGKTGGWFSHFFATPARQMRAKFKIPFYSRFKGKNAEVAAAARVGISKLVRRLANRTFR